MQPVRAGFFSFTPSAGPDDDGRYLRWHLLDHLPEQFRLPGIVLAHRWTAEPDLLAHQVAGAGRWAELGNLVQYYVSDPVEPTVTGFFDLAQELREAGRFPERRPSLGLAILAHQRWRASPSAVVSDAVVPHRPHRGIVLLVEAPLDPTGAGAAWLEHEHEPTLLDVAGVAGLGRYRTGPWDLPATVLADLEVTVLYVDGDPARVTAAVAPMLEERWAATGTQPLFAGPLRSTVSWAAWP